MAQRESIPAVPTDLRSTVSDYLMLAIGAVLFVITFDVFQAPSNLAPGGVSGTSLIISHFTGWPKGMVILVLNIPIMMVGFRYLGRFRFFVRTLYVVLIYTIGVDLLAGWLPAGITDDLLLNALYGGVLGGIGTGFVFRGRGSSAGTGVLSRILQLKTGVPVSQIYILVDGTVILTLGLVFGWINALYAMIMLFVWGLATDYVLEGPSVVRTAFIITDRPDEVADVLLHRLHVGVTAWSGEGMFTHAMRTTLFCTVLRSDVNSLKAWVAHVGPRAFVVIGQGHQASGGVLRQPEPALRQEPRGELLATAPEIGPDS